MDFLCIAAAVILPFFPGTELILGDIEEGGGPSPWSHLARIPSSVEPHFPRGLNSHSGLTEANLPGISQSAT